MRDSSHPGLCVFTGFPTPFSPVKAGILCVLFSAQALAHRRCSGRIHRMDRWKAEWLQGIHGRNLSRAWAGFSLRLGARGQAEVTCGCC